MAYIGNNTTIQQYAPTISYFNGNGSTTVFTLPISVASAAQILVFIENVPQNPATAFTVSGTTLTFTSAPPSGTNNVWVEYTSLQTNSIAPSQGTVQNSSFGSITSIPFVNGGSIGGGNSSLLKNRIINGAMVIDQRNAGAAITPTQGQYSLDRWQCYLTQSGKYTVQQNAGAVTPPTGFTKYLGVTSTSAYSITSTDNFLITQKIEGYNIADLGWGTASAKTVTLSFQVYSSLTGTFGGAVINSAQNRSYPFNYTVGSPNTWTTASITIAGDTSGTWATDNSNGIWLMFGLGVGSTNSATAGSWTGTSNIFSATGATSVVGTSGATWYVSGVQLEVGTSATGFEYVNYQTSLANCQRYYTKLIPLTATGQMGVGITVAATTSWVIVNTPVNFRASPTIGFSSLTISDDISYALAVSAIAASDRFSSGSGIAFTHAGSATVARTAIVAASSSGYIDFSAEL